ncbi:JAB domain-containing protein [Candidatus Sumerlaeota bacterium]
MPRIPIVTLRMVRDKTVQYHTRTFCDSASVFDFAREIIGDRDREVFLVLCLDTKNRLVCLEESSVGAADFAVCVPRDVLKVALLSNATAIIAAHNHPSGDPTPSAEDRRSTEHLKQAAELLGLKFLDHVIVGDGSFFSFAQEGY